VAEDKIWPNIIFLCNIHRIIEWFGLEGNFGHHLVQNAGTCGSTVVQELYVKHAGEWIVLTEEAQFL